MLAIAGQTAGPNWLNYLGENSWVQFDFFYSTDNAAYLRYLKNVDLFPPQ